MKKMSCYRFVGFAFLLLISTLSAVHGEDAASLSPLNGEERRVESPPPEGPVLPLSYGKVTVYTEEVHFDPRTNEITAEGGIRIVGQGSSLAGDRLRLDLDNQTGEIVPATAHFRNIIMRANRIGFFPNQISAYDASFTTCDLPEPHYRVLTKQANVYTSEEDEPGTVRRVEIRGGGLELYGHRLISLPPFRFNLSRDATQEQRTLPLPYPGYSRLDGPFQ